MKARFK